MLRLDTMEADKPTKRRFFLGFAVSSWDDARDSGLASVLLAQE